MYKVFVNNKPLFLIQVSGQPKITDSHSVKIISFSSNKEIKLALDYCNSINDISTVYLVAEDIEKLWEQFLKKFIVLEAAGGIVKNNAGELLMIYRFGKWDLPKGKIEKNEEPSEAAIREVCEETGVCDVAIISEPKISYHTYIHHNNHFLKKTYWYEMSCNTFSGFKLQAEEGIGDAKWISNSNLEAALELTYPSIREILAE